MEIRRQCRQRAENFMSIQKDEFEKLSIFTDWKNSYFTMDSKYQVQELGIFSELNRKGYLLRDQMPLFFSPYSNSVVSKSDVEYNPDHIGRNLIFSVEMVDKIDGFPVHVPILTTTPWTVVSNSAIAYNKTHKYLLCRDKNNKKSYIIGELFLEKFKSLRRDEYEMFPLPVQYFEDASYYVPMQNNLEKQSHFYHGDFVEANYGTGFVHMAPAHGLDDYNLASQYKLKFDNYVDEKGYYNKDCIPEFIGKSVFDASIENMVLDILGENVMEYTEVKQNYPYEWRTKKPVITILSKQWFINLESITPKAIDCLANVQVYPKAFKGMLENFLMNRPKWCISRQRYWGLPIPVYFCKDTNQSFLDEEFIQHIADKICAEGDSNFWWQSDNKDLVPDKFLKKWDRSLDDLVRGKDIFDVWFDSGTSWNHLYKDQIVDLYFEGPDQFRGWFSASTLLSVATRGCVPFKKLAIHGFAVDSKGNKMSKSLGNVVSIADVLDRSHNQIDILRSWVAHSSLNQKCNISLQMIDKFTENYKTLINKFRFICAITSDLEVSQPCPNTINSLFKLLYSESPSDFDLKGETFHVSSLDHVFLNDLADLVHSAMTDFYPNFKYNLLVNEIHQYLENYSNLYLSAVKDVLYCNKKDDPRRIQAVQTSWIILETLKGLLAIIMPNLVENIDQVMTETFKIPSSSGYINRLGEIVNCSQKDITRWNAFLQGVIQLKTKENMNKIFKDIILIKEQVSGSIVRDDTIQKSSTNPLLRITLKLNRQHYEKFKPFCESSVSSHFDDMTLILRCVNVLFVDSQELLQCKNILTVGEYQIGMDVEQDDSSLCPRCRRYLRTQKNLELCSRCQKFLS